MNISKVREKILDGKTIYDLKLNVVDYGRVSTDKNEQLNSLENQKKYFKDFISKYKNWNHVASYKDEGISGTQVKKREQFLKMIEDAKEGKIDLILTKEVSRFARNTIDSIKYTQLLLSYGVIVFFISDNINTIYPDSEFRLTLMASMAQDEVRKLSERVRFGIKRSIKDGKLIGGSLFGYFKKNGKLKVIPEEAKIIKMIFTLYTEEEYGLKKIGVILKEKNIFTRRGNIFSDATLKKIIKNPRYKGYYTANLSEVVDYKTHKKKYYDEKEWIIYKDKNIPSIVDENLWNKANELLKKRHNCWNKNIINKNYILENNTYTSKIICKEHNTSYIRCASGKRKNNPVWQCNEYLRHGLKGCTNSRLFENKLNEKFIIIIKKIFNNKKELLNEILDDYKMIIIEEINNSKNIDKEVIEQKKIKENLLNLLLKKIISEEEYIKKSKIVSNKLFELKERKELLKNENNNKLIISMRKVIEKKLDIENNIQKYFNLFVKEVIVNNIDKGRKNTKLLIRYNFKKDDEIIYLN